MEVSRLGEASWAGHEISRQMPACLLETAGQIQLHAVSVAATICDLSTGEAETDRQAGPAGSTSSISKTEHNQERHLWPLHTCIHVCTYMPVYIHMYTYT